jgi:hypothetical protein
MMPLTTGFCGALVLSPPVYRYQSDKNALEQMTTAAPQLSHRRPNMRRIILKTRTWIALLATALGPIGFIVGRFFPTVQRISIVSDATHPASAEIADPPDLIYKVFYESHVPANDGFLGIGKTPPIWTYRLWILNDRSDDIHNVYVSTSTANDVTPVEFDGDLRESPDAPLSNSIANSNHLQKLRFYIDKIPPGTALPFTLIVQGRVMPELEDLGISVRCDGAAFATVPDSVWEKKGWENGVPR